MDILKKNIATLWNLAALAVLLSVCSCTLLGLELQQDHKHEVNILSPEIHMDAWQFINTPLEDTLRSFDRFVDAVVYAGLEDEYTKPGRTFLVFNNYAILRYNSSGTVNSGCYFGRNTVPVLDEDGNPVLDEDGEPMMRPGRRWEDYPVEQVRELLLYHILEGEYSYHNLGPDNTVVQSLSPNNEANLVYLQIQNTQTSKLAVNAFQGSIQTTLARTANLKATNGYIHVFDAYLRYGVEMQ
ncbi:Fasciclin domain-containing protein [Parapedobacter composti]|uniref:Fasciclin domain-containing protein n=1 Tax=Parapedobacter composti TaxID=623281 RepID=A0A1I1EAX2_9SPHI|nr:fasciclin domain-containing protein [Parapedobacter composti]SFB82160.1 Fasciclin domain-containing protein [Parapedobacter composti]